MNSLSTENILPSSQKSFKNAICSHYPGSSLGAVRWASIVAQSCGMQLSKHQILHKDTRWWIENSLYQTEQPYLTYALQMLSTYKKIQGIWNICYLGWWWIRWDAFWLRTHESMPEINLRFVGDEGNPENAYSTVTGIYPEKEKIRKEIFHLNMYDH